MKNPSSQFIATLVSRTPTGGPVRLMDAIYNVWKANIRGFSDEQILEESEGLQKYVFNELIEIRSRLDVSGIKPAFTVEEDNGIYFFTCVLSEEIPVLKKIIDQDPKQFEILCADILIKLGARAEVVAGDKDGGVDFIGYDLPLGCIKFETNIANQLLVIGQAKRYKDGLITETMLREFVGAATKKRYDLLVEQRCNARYIQPTIFAYWTTSEFHSDAQKYIQKTGVWALSGVHVAQLVVALGLDK